VDVYWQRLRPAKPDWFSIVGEAARDFAPGAAERALVRSRCADPPATYSVRLDAVAEANPDEDFTEGPSVSFDVSLPAPPVPWWKKYWWIFVIAGVVLLVIIGVVVWLLLRGNGSTTTTVATATVPAVVNLNQADAEITLQKTGFAVQVHKVPTINTLLGIVVNQDPAPQAVVPQGSVVAITVGAIFIRPTTLQ
jgi:hypothetical protein